MSALGKLVPDGRTDRQTDGHCDSLGSLSEPKKHYQSSLIILARETKLTKKDVLEILPESHPPYQTFNALCFILWLKDENYNFRVK